MKDQSPLPRLVALCAVTRMTPLRFFAPSFHVASSCTRATMIELGNNILEAMIESIAARTPRRKTGNSVIFPAPVNLYSNCGGYTKCMLTPPTKGKSPSKGPISATKQPEAMPSYMPNGTPATDMSTLRPHAQLKAIITLMPSVISSQQMASMRGASPSPRSTFNTFTLGPSQRGNSSVMVVDRDWVILCFKTMDNFGHKRLTKSFNHSGTSTTPLNFAIDIAAEIKWCTASGSCLSFTTAVTTLGSCVPATSWASSSNTAFSSASFSFRSSAPLGSRGACCRCANWHEPMAGRGGACRP
mmetsp:Transcript_34443/g.97870  ORF Transcript_34443/g.97870 Transcript_34443/m.97870 type:complete len:300 (+) Transcript_34443:1059-1958(+)